MSETLYFLSAYGVEFGDWLGSWRNDKSVTWLLIGFVLVLFFRNSIEILNNFKSNYKTALLGSFYFVVSVLLLRKVYEFLYFNF